MVSFYVSLLVRLIFGPGRAHLLGCGFCDKGPQEQGALAETRLAYSKEAPGLPGRYLIVAKSHWVRPGDFPVTWWFHVQWLLRTVDARLDNTSQNWTPEGGRMFEHGHLWAITNRSNEEGTPAYHKGMAFLIDWIKGNVSV